MPNKHIQVLLATILFTLFFYEKSLGINVLLYEVIILTMIVFQAVKTNLWSKHFLLPLALVLFTSIMTVVHHSTLSYVINFMTFFLFIGLINNTKIKSWWIAISASFVASFASIQELFEQEEETNRSKLKFNWRKWSMFVLPIGIIILFLIFYSGSNPAFDRLISKIGTFLNDNIFFVFKNVKLSIVLTILLGWVTSVFLLVRSSYFQGQEKDTKASDDLVRKKSGHSIFKNLGFKYHYQSAVFLFACLNFILLILNYLDVVHVWFGFEFEGQFLKDFVHEGTYFLILSILISVSLVLFYFKGSINFYSKNKWLKRLAVIWLAQNLFLSISVAIRTIYYVQYYSLAHGRIAVFIFLILVAIGIVTVYIKVAYRKTSYYLFRVNTVSFMLVLSITTAFNWDKIIAKYNFKNAEVSFLHLNFMANLSDSALPYLEQDIELLEKVDQSQLQKLSKSYGSSSFEPFRKLYMSPDNYVSHIKKRKVIFVRKWKNKSWLEWNWAEAEAYEMIKNKKR